MRAALALSVLCLGLGGFSAGAEDAVDAEVEAEAVGNDRAETTITLNGVDYAVAFDLSGAEPIIVNGQEMVTKADLPLSVGIGRGDGATMADEAYVLREVLQAACRTRGFSADLGVAPLLSPSGQWIFPAGCMW